MKLIIQLIILILTIKQCFAFEKLFVNLVPYQTSSCSKGGAQSSGIGFSGIIDTCLTIDGLSNFKFTLGSNKMITWSTYKAKNVSEVTCTTDNQVSSTTASIGSCVASKSFDIDSDLMPVNPFFYEVSVSVTPLIQDNSVVKMFMNGESCTSDNALIVEYITVGTFALSQQDSGTFEYICSNGVPEIVACDSHKKNCKAPTNAALDCYDISPFFNGSSFELPCSSGSQQGSESCAPLPFSGASAGASSGAVSSGSGFSSGFASPSMKTSGSTGAYTNYIANSDSTTGNSYQEYYKINNNNLNSMNPLVLSYLTTYCSSSN
ncbi:hypothetical protein ACTFIY_010166 [Dictyostelium cf. discoideum]